MTFKYYSLYFCFKTIISLLDLSHKKNLSEMWAKHTKILIVKERKLKLTHLKKCEMGMVAYT